MNYCSVPDLYAFGVQRGSFSNPGRLINRISTADDCFTLDDHGFALDDPLTFRAEGSGSMASPLTEGTTYYAIPIDDARFKVAPTLGGSPIDLLSAGARMIVVGPSLKESAIHWASEVISDMLPAAVLPLVSIPEIVRLTTAELAAAKLLGGGQLGPLTDAAQKRIARWASGVSIRGENAPAPANVAISASAPYQDSRGWSRFGGIR